MNFNVQNFDQLVNNAMASAEGIVNGLLNVSGICNESSGIYASEDSNISGVYSNIANTISAASNKFSDLMNDLVQLLMEYRTKTLENESQTATAATNINATLEGAMAAIEALAGLK